MTKLDVLDESDPILVCTAYRYRGEVLTEFDETGIWPSASPRTKGFPAAPEHRGRRRRTPVPPACQAYLRRREELVNVPLTLVSTGPRRDETIVRANALWQSWGLA